MAILQEKLNHNLMQSIATEREKRKKKTSFKLNDIYCAGSNSLLFIPSHSLSILFHFNYKHAENEIDPQSPTCHAVGTHTACNAKNHIFLTINSCLINFFDLLSILCACIHDALIQNPLATHDCS